MSNAYIRYCEYRIEAGCMKSMIAAILNTNARSLFPIGPSYLRTPVMALDSTPQYSLMIIIKMKKNAGPEGKLKMAPSGINRATSEMMSPNSLSTSPNLDCKSNCLANMPSIALSIMRIKRTTGSQMTRLLFAVINHANDTLKIIAETVTILGVMPTCCSKLTMGCNCR